MSCGVLRDCVWGWAWICLVGTGGSAKAERCSVFSAGTARATAARRAGCFPSPYLAVPRCGVSERCPSLHRWGWHSPHLHSRRLRWVMHGEVRGLTWVPRLWKSASGRLLTRRSQCGPRGRGVPRGAAAPGVCWQPLASPSNRVMLWGVPWCARLSNVSLQQMLLFCFFFFFPLGKIESVYLKWT